MPFCPLYPCSSSVCEPVWSRERRGRFLASTASRRAQARSPDEREKPTDVGGRASSRNFDKCLQIIYALGVQAFPAVGKGAGIAYDAGLSLKKVRAVSYIDTNSPQKNEESRVSRANSAQILAGLQASSINFSKFIHHRKEMPPAASYSDWRRGQSTGFKLRSICHWAALTRKNCRVLVRTMVSGEVALVMSL